ncbi:hypothetical protein [Mycolicibacterium fortuitum]|uniref:PE-PGRS family protein n=1 Tax=Mycolicibacterium fortuitum subsp. fortuitum DSM 46621 = ATCC 6841 = JCM 6387 TaxID=1214102 RepID=K0V812_MYCFO|nr:hypothetical protein [Mycolicibacterium fortuitum]CRL74825.1 PE family protein [Mycolicibacter nonchromogenicus]EJZ15151.1 hypothetical protein MFORT_05984 [Mycolicibacterium fortuitum subsp. fortuitum DSM 46621 = ATCC 6841 = JCM 6387]WEV31391.1 hypothetical protein OMF10_22525 [Mycolicibacterium fortuitum]CRL58768.1 PE family protein [Mycolicibacterium fortuitum subsp. fortuitum DSM 46621 = ATCC 6841 = JCM 6387]BDE00396.1 hypothetical protein MFTT_44890 [Mycolicibacterium fortuitum subsp. 
MSTHVRSYLVAGAAAATATAIALTPVQAAPADIAVPAHPTSTQPQLTQAMVDLLAAASRMTAAVAPNLSGQTGSAPAFGAAPAAAATGNVTAAPTAIAIAPNLANTIDQVYVTVEPWVQWGFEVGAYALGWVPWVGGWAGGLLMDAYTFGESLVASGVFNFTDWLRGDGGIIQNLADFGADAVLAVAWLGIDVVGTFIPLPPIPLPPRPPLQGPFLASTLAAPTAALEGAVQNPLTHLTDAITKARDDFATAVKSLTEGTGLATLADRLKEQTAATEKTPVTEVAGSPVDQAIEGAVHNIENASENLATGLNETVKDVAGNVGQQFKQVTDEIGVVPRSVRQSLRNTVADTTVTGADAEEAVKTGADAEEAVKTGTDQVSADKPATRSVRQGVRAAVDKATTDAPKAGGDARDVVKTAVKNLAPKPKAKTDKTASPKDAKPKQSNDSGDSGKSKKDSKK